MSALTRVARCGAPVLEVRLPSPIVGVGLRSDLEVAPDDGFIGTNQLQPVRSASRSTFARIGRKAPTSSVYRVPVSMQHPVGILAVMPASRPPPETVPKYVIHLAESACRHN